LFPPHTPRTNTVPSYHSLVIGLHRLLQNDPDRTYAACMGDHITHTSCGCHEEQPHPCPAHRHSILQALAACTSLLSSSPLLVLPRPSPLGRRWPPQCSLVSASLLPCMHVSHIHHTCSNQECAQPLLVLVNYTCMMQRRRAKLLLSVRVRAGRGGGRRRRGRAEAVAFRSPVKHKPAPAARLLHAAPMAYPSFPFPEH
jgi:hypothetical protein